MLTTMIKRLVALALMTVSFTAMAAIGPAAARGGGPGNQGGFGYHGGHRGGFDHHGGQPGSGSPHGCGYRYCSTELH